MPTNDYFTALAEAQKHHASSKTYSGKFLRPHAPFIKEIIDRLGCKSVLDYGCGKGVQYSWVSHGEDAVSVASIPKGMTIEEYWGIPVTKYDPAYPPFAAEPQGKFDLVLCTHTLGAIPASDLEWVVDRLYSFAGKAIYVAEKLGPVKKKVYSHENLRPNGWTRQEWHKVLKRGTCIEVTLATRERTKEGVIVQRGLV